MAVNNIFKIKPYLVFNIIMVLWLSLVAIPLPFASPFGDEKSADIPLYEIITPILGIFLFVNRIKRATISRRSPLSIPLFMWFTLVILTYLRNPVALLNFGSISGIGALYHILFKSIICMIIYFVSATILNTSLRLYGTAQVILKTMIIGLFVMIVMYISGINIPFLTGGVSPWAVGTITLEEGVIYRCTAMSNYSELLILTMICFSSTNNIKNLIIVLILLILLILGGGRSALITLGVYSILSFMLHPKTRMMILISTLLIILSLIFIAASDIELPYTTRRVTNFSTESKAGIGGRYEMVSSSMKLIMEKPFFGYGYGELSETKVSQLVASGNPHTGFLSVMLSYGILGLVLFLWCLGTAIRIGLWLYMHIEDKFIKHLSLWVTLHLSGVMLNFFISSEAEKNIITYLDMGIITSIYSIYSIHKTLKYI